MVETLSQLITLASAANGVISGKFDPAGLFPGHRDFRFCRRVDFIHPHPVGSDPDAEPAPPQDPAAWLAGLGASGATRVRLQHLPSRKANVLDYKQAAYAGGGGHWMLLVDHPDRCEYWMPRWELAPPDDDLRGVWIVTYGCVASTPYSVDAELAAASPADEMRSHYDDSDAPLSDVVGQFRSALDAALRFAERHELLPYAEAFRRGIASLDTPVAASDPNEIDFVCLECYPDMAQRIFAAAYASWVFGGAGSWNDLEFETDAETTEHETISTALYDALNDSVVRATNSFRSVPAG